MNLVHIHALAADKEAQARPFGHYPMVIRNVLAMPKPTGPASANQKKAHAKNKGVFGVASFLSSESWWIYPLFVTPCIFASDNKKESELYLATYNITNHYPIGKKKMQPVGIIVFASVMGTPKFQILLESAIQLIAQLIFVFNITLFICPVLMNTIDMKSSWLTNTHNIRLL
nr:metal tolerance protein 9-like [Tanacetum cinerariifolium]